MEPSSRRSVGRLVRFGLIAIALVLVATWLSRRMPGHGFKSVKFGSDTQTVDSLAPGDLRLYNDDSTVNLILSGNNVLAGLSPKTIAKVREKLGSTAETDTAGLGGNIAQFVKKTVGSAIGTHVVYPIAEMRDMRHEDGEMIIISNSGERTRPFGNTKVDGQSVSRSFPPDEARRFIDAVRARKGAPVDR